MNVQLARAVLSCFLIAFFTVAVGARQSQEQQQPSLEDTTKWLTEKLPSLAGWVQGEKSSKIDSVEFHGCTLTYRDTFTSTIGFISTISIPMANIDPDVKVGARSPRYQCILKTITGRSNTIKVETAGVAGGRISRDTRSGLGDSLTSRIEIDFSDEATAERFAKAFARLATLCAAKKEPF